MPCSIPINKPKPTDEIIFIGFDGDVDTDQLPTQLSTGLFNRKRFTITRQTRNERRIEGAGLNNLANIAKITKLDEGIIFIRNEVLFYGRHTCRCFESLFQFFLDRKVPLTTTIFVVLKFLRDGRIRHTIHRTVCTKISRCNVVTVQTTEFYKEVLGVQTGSHFGVHLYVCIIIPKVGPRPSIVPVSRPSMANTPDLQQERNDTDYSEQYQDDATDLMDRLTNCQMLVQ